MGNKIGIAFVGGGGKGAYQIGVWKALIETGLDKEVKAVSGTSVGALNAAMFVQGKYSKAENVWKNLSPSQILNWSLGLKSVFTSSNLEKIIRNSVDVEDFGNSDINCWLTAWTKENSPISYTVPDSKGNTVTYKEGNAQYFKLNSNEYSADERVKILLASAALPIIFPPQEIDGTKYRDGGLVDNVPINPLYENEKCNIIIVIHLNHAPKTHDISIDREKYEGATIIEIWPKEYQGNKFTGTLDFVSQHARRRINQGYSETIDLFRDIVSCRSRADLSKNNVDEFTDLIVSKVNQNNEIYDKLSKLTAEWDRDKLTNLQAECAVLLKESQHRKLQLKDIKERDSVLIDILPQTANNQYEINRVLMLIQQITLNRIDLLQCEIKAMGIWVGQVEAKADLSLYIQTCNNMKLPDGRTFSQLSSGGKIIRLAYDFAMITHGLQHIKEEWFTTVCQNVGLPEKISLSEVTASITNDDLNNFLNKDWDYNYDIISDVGKLLHTMSIFSGKLTYNDTSTEMRSSEICQKLYNDFIDLMYMYQEKIAPETEIEISTRIPLQIIERRDNPDFISDVEERAKKYIENCDKELVTDNYTISQQCFDEIKRLCRSSNFCQNDNNDNINEILSLLDVDKDSVLLCHDDTKGSLSRGFAITTDGIYSYIDRKRQLRHITFEELANTKKFIRHQGKPNPLHPKQLLRRFIEADIGKDDYIPILPFKMIRGTVIIEFLEAIRNACWVDLYL